MCDGGFLTSVDDTTGDTDDTERDTTKTDDAAFDDDTISSTTVSTTRSATNDTTECCTCDCTEYDCCLDHGDGLKDDRHINTYETSKRPAPKLDVWGAVAEKAAVTATGKTTETTALTATATATATATTADEHFHGGHVGVTVLTTSHDTR